MHFTLTVPMFFKVQKEKRLAVKMLKMIFYPQIAKSIFKTFSLLQKWRRQNVPAIEDVVLANGNSGRGRGEEA